MGEEEIYEWQLSEAIVYLLTNDERMKEFWRNIEIEPYPEIKEMLTKLESIWKENPFDEFLKKAYEIFKK